MFVRTRLKRHLKATEVLPSDHEFRLVNSSDLGPLRIRDALLAKADFFNRIGDKELNDFTMTSPFFDMKLLTCNECKPRTSSHSRGEIGNATCLDSLVSWSVPNFRSRRSRAMRRY